MTIVLTNILFIAMGLTLSVIIGIAFGSSQRAASRRHQQLEQHGVFPTAWVIVPGSIRRLSFLLFALVIIQLVFPILFERDGMQWLVSAGIVLGYGWTLLDRGGVARVTELGDRLKAPFLQSKYR